MSGQGCQNSVFSSRGRQCLFSDVDAFLPKYLHLRPFFSLWTYFFKVKDQPGWVTWSPAVPSQHVSSTANPAPILLVTTHFQRCSPLLSDRSGLDGCPLPTPTRVPRNRVWSISKSFPNQSCVGGKRQNESNAGWLWGCGLFVRIMRHRWMAHVPFGFLWRPTVPSHHSMKDPRE